MAAKKKPIVIGTVRPGIVVGAGPGVLGSGSPGFRQRLVLGKDAVWLHSDDPIIDVVGRLYGKPSAALPRPKYDTVDRPGTIGLTRYRGHDPHVMTIPLLLDQGGRSVEQDIDSLEQLARRQQPSNEPPVVLVQGIGVKHDNLRWRVTFDDEPERVEYDTAGRRIRFWVTVILVEHITETLLAETLRGGKSAKGITNRRTRTHQGDTPYTVARREYGDPSRASDIVRANPGTRLGQRFNAGRLLRLP